MRRLKVRVHAARTLLAAGLSIAASGCAIPGGLLTPTSLATDDATIASATAFCVDEVNRLRATIGQPPLTRSAHIDAFSMEAARVDGESHELHSHFLQTNGGNGTVTAENTIPWWKLTDHGSVQTVVRKGVALMWAEGPGGRHHDTIRGGYTAVGCGIYVGNGEVTVSQDFR